MSENPFSQRVTPPDSLSQDRMAENPRTVSAPMEGFQKLKGMRDSTRYGILLFFLKSQVEWPLSDGQILWIVYRSRKLSLAELLRSGRLSELLAYDQKTFARLFREIKETYYRVPSLDPKRIPEKRTIGIGYRDKGSLRPLHERRIVGEEVFWDEDIAYMLPLDHKIEGRWITAEEVESLVGVDLQILATMQVMKQTHTRGSFYPWKAD